MTDFRKYEKVHRLGKEETDGILEGEVVVQEKLDGANTSIWLDNGIIKCGSRNRELDNEQFNGFVPYIQTHVGIGKLLKDYPEFILYGEWLVKHTITYKSTAYQQWYMFDIYNVDSGLYLSQTEVAALATVFDIKRPQIFGVLHSPTLEQLKEFVGKTEHGDKGEGIVIKRAGWKNSFGDHCYAKVVTENFKEDNAVTFGGNNKFSDSYWEVYVVNKYMTLARIKKIINKIQPEVNGRLSEKHIPRILNTAYHDMMTEEVWEIAQKVQQLNFATLKRIAMKKARQIYMDILHDSISVADING